MPAAFSRSDPGQRSTLRLLEPCSESVCWCEEDSAQRKRADGWSLFRPFAAAPEGSLARVNVTNESAFARAEQQRSEKDLVVGRAALDVWKMKKLSVDRLSHCAKDKEINAGVKPVASGPGGIAPRFLEPDPVS